MASTMVRTIVLAVLALSSAQEVAKKTAETPWLPARGVTYGACAGF